MLRVQHLTIAFPPDPPAVSDLSFELGAGERLGVLGLSGSGKSLTALALLGLLPAAAVVESGEIWYTPEDGPPVDLLTLSEREWRAYRGREISLVFQEPLTALNPTRRVGRQLLEAVRQFRPDLRTADRRAAHLNEWLARVELTERRIPSAFPHELSGGQRQRLLIALALLAEPRLLIADEPTTALDTVTEAGLLALLEKLRAELGMASIFITHDLNVMRRGADDLLVMAAGRTIRRGPAQQLLPLGDALFREAVENEVVRRTEAFEKPTFAPATPPLLSVKNLVVAYAESRAWPWSKQRQKTAVNDVSFQVAAGEWVAIVGPSGCGKTSIARCLAGLQPRASGEITVAESGNVQLIFQDPFSSLNPAHTVGYAITEVLRVGDPGQKKTQYRQAAHALLDAVGLPAGEYADRRPAALSGGQRQRVAIARALAGKPTVLIADEAVSALDAPLRRDVLDLLDRIRRERRIALLFISHDLRLVAERADRVLIMDDGRIVETGDAGVLIRQPKSEMGRRLVAAL